MWCSTTVTEIFVAAELRAYVVVQVKHLKDAELQGEERAKPKRPRALVLGPTRELTDQILGVAKSMSHFAKFRSACVNGGAALRPDSQ